jgi:chemotaxis protein methyltransferase CheR
MEQWLNSIVLQIRDLYGVDISKFEKRFLINSIEKRITINKFGDYEQYSSLILNDENEADLFFKSLNINYSEFFRNKLTYSYLEQVVIPAIIASKLTRGEKEIRIWSSACSTGQEPYSVAIICEELTAVVKDRIQYRIIATDIGEQEICAAKAGVYTPLSLGNVPYNYLNKYFIKSGDNFLISDGIKAKVNFSLFNLLEGEEYCPPASIFGNFDLVLCCNIFFYYKPEYRRVIIERLSRCFTADTYLVTGDAERAFIEECGFREVAPFTAIFKKRNYIK